MRTPPNLLGLARTLSVKLVSGSSQAGPSTVFKLSSRAEIRRPYTSGPTAPDHPVHDPPSVSETLNTNASHIIGSSEEVSEPSNPEGPSHRVGKKSGTAKGTSKSQKSRSSQSKTQPEEEHAATNNDYFQGLEMWSSAHTNIDVDALPPTELLEEALANLKLAFHPQAQRQAVDAPLLAKLEPSLALYCPIEGGMYIIDATVQELARRTDAEVSVIDGAHLLAGEWGKYATSSQMAQGLLQFCLSPALVTEDDMDEDIMAQILRGPPIVDDNLKLKLDALVQAQSTPLDTEVDQIAPNRPRIIYVRDLVSIAPFTTTWYPSLLQAVHNRRIKSPSSENPTVIIFGITPPSEMMHETTEAQLRDKRPSEPASNINSSSRVAAVEKAREKRLKARLSNWSRGLTNFYDELPSLLARDLTVEESPTRAPFSFVVMMSPTPRKRMQASVKTQLPVRSRVMSGNQGILPDGVAAAGRDQSYFRASFLLPSKRSIDMEQRCRAGRRAVTNELLLRMAVGAAGGTIDGPNALPEVAVGYNDVQSKWDNWIRSDHSWVTIRTVADRALASTLSDVEDRSAFAAPPQNLSPVPWSALHRALLQLEGVSQLRQAWPRNQDNVSSSLRRQGDMQETDEVIQDRSSVSNAADDNLRHDLIEQAIERVKEDESLNEHERRLLACIVSPSTMPTSFAQVHLPAKTIDAVRTIVSLPLLYPQLFSIGVLKENSMTGALLFGPPGVGKTLMARALAKEAGCQMMIVRASDVHDMYVGEGEKLIRAVFTLARRLSPCIVFLDEIDALLGQRASHTAGRGGEAHHRSTLTEWMQEMDGLRTASDAGVIVIGATNRPYDLDDAVLRRLPRRLLIDLPGEKDREAILKILLRNESLDSEVDLNVIAKMADNFSGSDLKHLCVAAALKAIKESIGHNLPWEVENLVKKDTLVTTLSSTETIASVEALLSVNRNENSHQGSNDSSSNETLEANCSEGHEPSLSLDHDNPKQSDARILTHAHFSHAFKEISASSSEFLGSTTALRKWNDMFGEGAKQSKRVQVWGKDRFGFTRVSSNDVRPEA